MWLKILDIIGLTNLSNINVIKYNQISKVNLHSFERRKKIIKVCSPLIIGLLVGLISSSVINWTRTKITGRINEIQHIPMLANIHKGTHLIKVINQNGKPLTDLLMISPDGNQKYVDIQGYVNIPGEWDNQTISILRKSDHHEIGNVLIRIPPSNTSILIINSSDL